MGYVSFFENFVQIVVLLFAWVVVLLAFFILAVQLFVTLIEFKLTTLAGFVLIPVRPVRQDRLHGRARARQRHLVRRQGAGACRHRRHRLDAVQPVHAGFGGNQPTIEDAMALVLAALSLCSALASSVPASPTASSPAVRSSAPARPSAPRLAAGGIVAAGAAGAAMGSRGRGRRARRCRAWRCVGYGGASTAYRAGGFAGLATIRRVNHCRFVSPICRRDGIGNAGQSVFDTPGERAGLGAAHEPLEADEPRRSPQPPTPSAPATMAAAGASVDLSEGDTLMSFKRPSVRYGQTPAPETPYQKAAQVWDERIGSARVQARTGGSWPSAICCCRRVSRRASSGNPRAARSCHGWSRSTSSARRKPSLQPIADYRPTDPQIAWHLARFIEQVRGLSRPIRSSSRQNWLRAYDFTTDRGAAALNDYARSNDPFAKVGKVQIRGRGLQRHPRVAELASASPGSSADTRTASSAATERWTAILTIVINTPRDADRLRKNPLGVFVNAINWSKELGNDERSCPQYSRIAVLLLSASTLAGCAIPPKPPPEISLRRRGASRACRRPAEAGRGRRGAKAATASRPAQAATRRAVEARSRRSADRVDKANAAARVQPTRNGYINAMQVYPFATGALYQVYAAPGQITDIALQEGEQLVGSGPVAAGDTVRWIIGDTESGTGPTKRVHILVKPTRPDLVTNLVINTDRRTYHPRAALRRKDLHGLGLLAVSAGSAHCVAPPECDRRSRDAVMTGARHLTIATSATRSRATIRPGGRFRAFDDGSKVFIEFPRGIVQGEMPPLFVIGPEGEAKLVNYRVRQNYYIVDRLFAAAELRLGGEHQQNVRIVRTDGRAR